MGSGNERAAALTSDFGAPPIDAVGHATSAMAARRLSVASVG